MVPEDVPAVAEIEAQSYNDAWPLESFADWFAYDDGLSVVCVDATKGGAIAGFVLYESHSRRLHIADVAVSPGYRRQGIGERLMHTVIGNARARNCKRVTLEVRLSNASAIACYKKLGFTIRRNIHGYYEDGEDALYMQLRLKAQKSVV